MPSDSKRGDMNRDELGSAEPRPRHPRTTEMRRRERESKRATLVPIVLVSVVALVALVWGGWMILRPKHTSTPVLASPPSAGRLGAKPSAPLVGAINGFGFEVLRRSMDANADNPSVVLSPVSVHSALALAESGASGHTSESLRKILQIGSLKPAAERQAYADLLVGLAESEKEQLVIANSVWIDEGAAYKQSFIDTDKRFFGAEARTTDLQSQPGINEINWWVAKNTGDRIARMIADPLPKTASAGLFNAAYFLGTWQTQFDPKATVQADFHVASVPAVKVQMMSASGSFEHTRTKSYEAIRLPYKNSGASMLVIVPNAKSSLTRMLSSFDSDRLTKVRRGLTVSKGSLQLPRLDTRGGLQLREPLGAMGMADAFSSSRADFSAMTEKGPTWFDRIQHSTYLHVDEQGSEAAAATALDNKPTTAGGFTMAVDRPYLTVIVDDRSGAILFLAAIRDPRG
jgi:serine protease inhibitor